MTGDDQQEIKENNKKEEFKIETFVIDDKNITEEQKLALKKQKKKEKKKLQKEKKLLETNDENKEKLEIEEKKEEKIEQTYPLKIPITSLFPNNDYPFGEIQDYVDEM
jgi:hypothetical protein